MLSFAFVFYTHTYLRLRILFTYPFLVSPYSTILLQTRHEGKTTSQPYTIVNPYIGLYRLYEDHVRSLTIISPMIVFIVFWPFLVDFGQNIVTLQLS
jgi:hypothetical protein